MHSNGTIFHYYLFTYVYLQHDPKSLKSKIIPKCFKIVKYNAMFKVKVVKEQGLRRMEVLADENAYINVFISKKS